MSAAKFTPGPWVVEFRQPVGVPGVNVAFGIDAQDAISVCSGQSQDDLGSTHAILEAECRANGRLIAAAPTMLDELRACEKHLHDFVEAIENGGGAASKSSERLVAVRAALAKAVQS